VLVDITEIRPGVCALTASLAMSGRAMPFFGQVRSKATISKGQSIARFLSTLKAVIPARCAPIIVTDAGFESPWFDRIEALGWDYVGRVRHKTRFLQDGTWVSAQDLHRQATQRARNLGSLRFPRHRPRARRLVLSKARCPKGRVRRNTLGRRGNTSNDKKCAQSAREPWLLATSLACNPTLVVEAYAMRMQIEQNYRDLKNHRWGWHLNLSRSRTNARIEMLLLVSMVATIVVFAIGCAAEKQQLHAAFQANTIKSRRVLSLFTLGVLLLRAQNNLRPHLQHALSELQHKIQSLPIESAT
jgi:hypothetical protein